MKGLVIRNPWIGMILAGTKTWEMRSRLTHKRGRIALIRAGSGLIVGSADLIGCRPTLSLAQMRYSVDFHGIPDDQIESAWQAGRTTPWVLSNVEVLDNPKPYKHKSGAVVWVDLPDEELWQPASAAATAPLLIKPVRLATATLLAVPIQTALIPRPFVETAAWVDIPITDGNIRNHHFYLRAASALLPADCIGGKNKQELGRSIRVRFEPGRVLDCDVAGDKMILRSRAETRDFFERTGASAGDCIRLTRIGDRDFTVSLQRAVR